MEKKEWREKEDGVKALKFKCKLCLKPCFLVKNSKLMDCPNHSHSARTLPCLLVIFSPNISSPAMVYSFCFLLSVIKI